MSEKIKRLLINSIDGSAFLGIKILIILEFSQVLFPPHGFHTVSTNRLRCIEGLLTGFILGEVGYSFLSNENSIR
jgi:hypothetical protein